MYTPRSLADSTAIRVFPINKTVILTECLLIICLVPININFVFSGFINKAGQAQEYGALFQYLQTGRSQAQTNHQKV